MNKTVIFFAVAMLCFSCGSTKNEIVKQSQMSNLLITLVKNTSPDFLNTDFKEMASFDTFKKANKTLNQFQTKATYEDGQLKTLLSALTQHDKIISAKVAGLNTSKIRQITAKKMTKTKPIKNQ